MATSSDSDALIPRGTEPVATVADNATNKEASTGQGSVPEKRSCEEVLSQEFNSVFEFLSEVRDRIDKLRKQRPSVDKALQALSDAVILPSTTSDSSISPSATSHNKSAPPIADSVPHSDFESVIQKLAASEDRAKDLESKNRELRAYAIRYKDQFKSSEREIEELKTSRNVIETRKNILEQDVSELTASFDKLQKAHEILEQESQRLKLEIVQANELRKNDSILIRQQSEEMHQKSEHERIRRMLFGDLSRSDESVRMMADQLVRATHDDDLGAVGLGARIMALRASAPEEASNLLKEIGEAYYRWKPRDDGPPDTTENSLVAYLTNVIIGLGLKNSIELVHSGDRYDSTRHFSNDRGVEVSAVRGWLVLRENGKPVTKANVMLR